MPPPVDAIVMLQLVYVSNATTAFSATALQALLVSARTRNEASAVTGMLVHQAGQFLQVLEGDEPAVVAVYDRIAADARHRQVLVLSRAETEARMFADWSMGFHDVTGTAAALPGFRTVGDLRGLAGETAAITRVVSQFRDGRWRHGPT